MTTPATFGSDLLPCPFCGCGVFPAVNEYPNPAGGSGWRAGCKGCGVSFPLNFTRELAIREWNRRVASPPATAQGWVAFAKEWPRLAGKYWGYAETGWQGEVMIMHGAIHVYDDDLDEWTDNCKITHWRDLPEPPPEHKP